MLKNKALAASASAAKVYIEDVFSTYLYTGNGSTQTITNGIDLAGKGGLVWNKSRSLSGGSGWHFLYDTDRGINSLIATNSSNSAYNITSTRPVSAFNANGFATDYNASWLSNNSGSTYCSWTFRKQPKFFDVITYTGNGVAGRTITHNLGSTPGCIIIKNISQGFDWLVWHRSETGGLFLNTTASSNLQPEYFWGNGSVYTAPTSTTFTVGNDGRENTNGDTFVAYVFAHNAGGFGDSGSDNVISCGSFTTDGSGNATVNLGWEPQWLLVKQSVAASDWLLIDVMRGASSSGVYPLSANSSNAENPSTGAPYWIPTSTGFSTTSYWGSATVIYIAIRRGPMKTPTDATKVFSANTSSGSAGTVLTTGFPVDLQLFRDRITSDSNYTITVDRLRGVSTTDTQQQSPLLATSSTAAESTGFGDTREWTNTGFDIASYTAGLPTIWWNFRRAPGFFDVVAYTGDGSSSRLISHNLGVPPELIITKRRDSTSTTGWFVSSKYYYVSTPWDRNGRLNDGTIGFSGGGVYEPASSHSSTVYPLSTNIADLNGSGGTYVAYLFASCPGVSKCGIYTGTGTTQQINCNFTSGARFVLIKRTDSAGDWYVWDTARGIIAGNDPYLLLNSAAAEVTGTDYIDTYAAGFEISSAAPAAINANGGSFIYLAIA
jgi:hypothetical protein